MLLQYLRLYITENTSKSNYSAILNTMNYSNTIQYFYIIKLHNLTNRSTLPNCSNYSTACYNAIKRSARIHI